MRRAIHLFGNALRETGQALDRFALEAAGNDIYKETFSRHRPVMNLFDRVSRDWSKFRFVSNLFIFNFQRPIIAAGCFIAPNASLVGKVFLHDSVSVRNLSVKIFVF